MKRILKKIFLILIFTTIVLSFGLFAYIINKIQDKEFYLQSLLIDNDNKILKAFFSPDDNLKDILLTLIACEKKSIKITMYTITEKDIAQALIDAHKKGIKVEFQTISEANHFFTKSESELNKCLNKYIKKETALY